MGYYRTILPIECTSGTGMVFLLLLLFLILFSKKFMG